MEYAQKPHASYHTYISDNPTLFVRLTWLDPHGRNWDDPNAAIVDCRSHVIAYRNFASQDINDMLFPLPLEQIPVHINAVLIGVCNDIETARMYIQGASALKINGRHVVACAPHLCEVRGIVPNEDVLTQANAYAYAPQRDGEDSN
jgi:hypothetical protein